MMLANTVLLSNDEALATGVARAIEDVPSVRLCVRNPGACPREIAKQSAAAVIFHHPEGDDINDVTRFLREIGETERTLPTIVISDQYNTAQALTLLQSGAADYLSRPLDISRLSLLINFLTCRKRATELRKPAPRAANAVSTHSDANGESGEMAEMLQQLRRAAPSLATVLLNGETGTGKNYLANQLHKLSPRRDNPYLVVNCAALVPSLVESEIFGHTKGAFTGANSDYVGKLEAAAEGTLLLDEIDALPLEIQPKLLRVLDERVFERVGSTESRPLQARLVVATNQDLRERVQSGQFREDLFYRINVVALKIRPLRERKSQIASLALGFLESFAARDGKTCELSAEALAALKAYDWPGNIRELRNVIEREVALCTGSRIEFEDLPRSIRDAASEQSNTAQSPRGGETSSKWFRNKIQGEVDTIKEALARTRNNRTGAARELGISRVTLYKKMHKYGLM